MSALPQQPTLSLEKHRNHYLFSDYYLDHLLPRRLDWQGATSEARAAMKRLQTIYAAFTPTENEAQTERDWIRPVLEALNHVFEVQPSIATPDGVRRPDYVFFPTEEARQAAKPLQGQEDYPAAALAVGDAKHWERSLDQTLKGEGRKPRDPFTNKNPSWQIYFYTLHTGRAWGILTNGRAWRLYHRHTAHKLNYYYEVDLPALLGNGDVEGFKHFYLFFRQASFIPNGEGRTWLDIILGESRDYAQGVSEDLKDQVYEALRHVAQGFLDYPGNDLTPDTATLKAIYDNSLILLYRLLFVLYAESRALLPVQENETYRLSYSLDAIKKEIEGALSKPILPTSRLYWMRLDELFGAINKGNEHLGVPVYNGDLFEPEKHPFLKRYAVGDQELRRAIDNLARTDTQEGRVFVDYRDLEVRHLGSIYEGLLEYQLRYAEEELAVVKEKGRERYVPAGEGQEVAVPDGRVYLVTDPGERKATGSYYTPDYIVKYIVEQTLEPLLDETFARWADHKGVTEENLADDILNLDVLDPAMGSGHFLVEATEYIARYLVGLGLEATAGMGAEAELDYWKRCVVQACIYGVDLNPLAVELAKLSLWLATVSKDKPLSFLNHHLRRGNSLIGARVADLGAALVVKKRKRRRKAREEAVEQLSMFDDDAFRQSMMTAVDSMWLIEGADSSTVKGVKEQERIYRQLRDELTRRYRRLADLKTACYFGVEIEPTMWPGLVGYATGRAPAQVPHYEAMLKQASVVAEDKRFFHWELEFPEVFFDKYGRPKPNPGFHALIGNPPWGAWLGEIEKQFMRDKFETSRGIVDTFALFSELCVHLATREGVIGQILPDIILLKAYPSIRRLLLDTCRITGAVHWGRPFPDATIDACTLILQRTGDPCQRTKNVIYIIRDIEDFPAGKWAAGCMTQGIWEELEGQKFNLYLTDRKYELKRKLDALSYPFSKLCHTHEGIHSGNIREKLFPHEKTSDKCHPLLFSGRELEPYLLTWRGRYVHYDQSIIDKDQGEYANLAKSEYFVEPKILIQRTGDVVIAALDTEGFYASNNLFVSQLRETAPVGYTYHFLLALLNSRLFTWYFRTIQPRVGRVFAELKIVHIDQFPVRSVFSSEPRNSHDLLFKQAANHYSDSDYSAVLDIVDTCVYSKKPQLGRVHDLLDYLGHHMSELRKLKREETQGFLAWLERTLGVSIEDLSGKTLFHEYYQLKGGVEDLLDRLKRNSNKITKLDIYARRTQDLIASEYERSMNRLEPLLAELDATSDLIDQVIYKLYELREDEITTVEEVG